MSYTTCEYCHLTREGCAVHAPEQSIEEMNAQLDARLAVLHTMQGMHEQPRTHVYTNY